MIEFGKRLKYLRKQKGLSQIQLAERLSVTRALISSYESSLRYPSLDMLIKLSYSFHVSTDYLLGLDNKQKLDLSKLTKNQINILNNIILEFEEKNN